MDSVIPRLEKKDLSQVGREKASIEHSYHYNITENLDFIQLEVYAGFSEWLVSTSRDGSKT